VLPGEKYRGTRLHLYSVRIVAEPDFTYDVSGNSASGKAKLVSKLTRSEVGKGLGLTFSFLDIMDPEEPDGRCCICLCAHSKQNFSRKFLFGFSAPMAILRVS